MVNRLIAPCNKLVADIVRIYLAACREIIPGYVMEVAWCQDDGTDRTASSTGMAGHATPASLLWLHSTYLIKDSATGYRATLRYQALLPSIFEQLQMQGITFLPGIGSSIVIHRPSTPVGLVGVEMLLELMNLQWAHIAITMEADRTLFRRLNTFAVTGQSASSTGLEIEARGVLTLYDRTRVYRSALDTVLIDLGRGAKDVWDAMARVQGLPEVLDSIRDKLDALQTACHGQLERASAQRQRRLGVAIDLFTIFSVVASVATVSTFVLDTQLRITTAPRIVMLAVTLTLIVTIIGITRTGGRRR